MTTTSTESLGLAISRAKAKSDLAMATTAAGLTIPRLAAKVSKMVGREIADSTLKMGAVRPGGDSRRIKRDVAEAVEKLIGFAATRANWPNMHD